MTVRSRLFRVCLAIAAGTTIILGAQPAYATQPDVEQPVPQPFFMTECYRFCVSPALLSSLTPTLTVSVAGTAGYFIYTDFEVRTAPHRRATLAASGQTGPVSPPRSTSFRVPEGVLVAERPYFWRARSTSEGGKTSAWSQWQVFAVDVTRPDMPVVGSQEYPERQWGAELGTEGTFHYSSAAFDVADFVWSLNSGLRDTVPATGTGPRTASVTFVPPRDLVNVLDVVAIDAAGNRSDTKNYQFWVTPPPLQFAHWTLDGTAEDSGNLEADAVLAGEVAFGPGYVGGTQGAVFTGAGGRITTSAPVLDVARSFTVMAWVNLADPSLGSQSIVSQDGFRLSYDATADAWCAALDGAQACGEWSPPTPGQWTHVAATYDAIAGTLAVFIGGDPESCGGEKIETAAAGAGSTEPLVIGDAWRGSIDDVNAYRVLLSGVEICQHASW